MSSFVRQYFLTCLILLSIVLTVSTVKVSAQSPLAPTPSPLYEICQGSGACPQCSNVDNPSECAQAFSCAGSLDEWNIDKRKSFWVNDTDISALGQEGERSRQFLFWTLTHRSIDNHPVILSTWSLSRDITVVALIVVAAIMGIGIIVGQRRNFGYKIEVAPLVTKLAISFLYAVFSAALLLFIIQIADTLMLVFIERLGVKDLFNIFFLSNNQGGTLANSETAYQSFQGCRNLSTGAVDSVKTSEFLIKLTNLTYYFIGALLIIRKIVLWFLLFISPFLAVLLPFAFVRNIGFIWIGVFFQWVFYGPLFALFLGGLARIWNSPSHIPFVFDFSRTHTAGGYVYPTAINILYGGPAQNLSVLNSSNYVDTFAEYAISLLMLLVAVILPWLLLRIFRDSCCAGIYAIKNILLSMYDQMRGAPDKPTPPFSPSSIGATLKVSQTTSMPVQVRLKTVNEIKKVKTEDISRSLNLKASSLTDIARLETDKNTRETVNRSLNSLKNPIAAATPTERQKFMNLRTELLNRAVKEDQVARHILSSISTSPAEEMLRNQRLAKTLPKEVPLTHIVSYQFKIPPEKVSSITSSLVQNTLKDSRLIASISQAAGASASDAQSTLSALSSRLQAPVRTLATSVAESTGVNKQTVSRVIKALSEIVPAEKDIISKISTEQNVSENDIQNVIQNQLPVMAEPEKHIEQTIAIPSSVSIEEYEQVKHMWQEQYEKGEVPISDNIKSRAEWVEKDIVFITNTLNKILADDDILKQQGLDDVGYIVPIFLINNMKGEELVVYLKAKIEAAKTVLANKQKETEIAEQLKNKAEEQFVDVAKPAAAEKAATMKMQAELSEKQ
ncbi:hypothetical protein HY214_04785 [Candidatus Roizmanbacteria bacterium]|nr:hypothetical protein [Candidatus Roizmanbacteria bacterium]